MNKPPRPADERILTLRRLGNLGLFGTTMAVGTLGMLLCGLQTRTEEQALTLAFTTFVLFQVFNAFNARADAGTAFNRTFFQNLLLWLAILVASSVLLLEETRKALQWVWRRLVRVPTN